MFRVGPLLLAGALLLTGCGSAGKREQAAPPPDAAIDDALADPIMTDPDLTSQNQAHMAIAVIGPRVSTLPPIDRSEEAIAKAREQAAALLGGTIPALPTPSTADTAPFSEAVTAAQMAIVAGYRACPDLQYSAGWALQLPAPLAVYPRGAVDEAAGGCGVAVVHFRTPVALDDVIAFYHASLRKAGSAVENGADRDDHLLRGRLGASRYVVYVRKADDGLTVTDIVFGP